MADSVVTSPSGVSEVIDLSSMRSPISGQNGGSEAPALEFTTRRTRVWFFCFVCLFFAQLKICPHRLRRHFLTMRAPPSLPRRRRAPPPHCTACSLAVLPESWGFMTSGSSGGVEKDSILSASNVSSERTTRDTISGKIKASQVHNSPTDRGGAGGVKRGGASSPLRRKASPTVAGA